MNVNGESQRQRLATACWLWTMKVVLLSVGGNEEGGAVTYRDSRWDYITNQQPNLELGYFNWKSEPKLIAETKSKRTTHTDDLFESGGTGTFDEHTWLECDLPDTSTAQATDTQDTTNKTGETNNMNTHTRKKVIRKRGEPRTRTVRVCGSPNEEKSQHSKESAIGKRK